MKNYFRIMLGAQSVHAEECFRDGFIGTDFGIEIDLKDDLFENWRDFNKKYIPRYLELRPEKSRVAAGLACGAIWTVSKGLQRGDVVLCPDGEGNYRLGEVDSNYFYQSGETLPHRRRVKWSDKLVARSSMSQALRNATGSALTVCALEKYRAEVEKLCVGHAQPILIVTDETIEDASTFALEKHLEHFLVENWKQTDLGKHYDILDDEGKLVGQQFPTDTGAMDILAISKDKSTYLVVELKKGRASDSVIGQVQRYMGYVREEIAEDHQHVKGVVIALEDDSRIQRALAVAPNIEFFRYQISFKLLKSSKQKAA